MSDNQVKPEATPVEPVADKAPEVTEASAQAEEEQQPQQPQLPPVAVNLPNPKNARTLPKPQDGESFSKLSLYSQPSETVQEIKLAVSEWVGGYWLGPHSLRLPGKGDDVLSTSKDGIEIRAGDKLSEFIDLADVFAHLPEDGDRVLDVVNEPYSESTARQAVVRLLEFIEPAGTTANNLTTPLGVGAGASIFEEVRSGSLYVRESPNDAVAKVEPKEDAKDAKEDEVIEHAFSDWTAGSAGFPLSKLPVAQAPVEINACLRSIQLSHFNPPPAPLRQKGHQLYLQVSILEGDVYTLVCSTRGWYVSKSNVNNFDPAPRDGSSPTHSLFDLLHSLSPLFTERLFALPSLSSTAPARDPLSTVAIPQAEPAYPWIIAEPKPATGPEILRTQLAYLHSGATSAEGLDNARDWNEEIQGVKELPHSTMPERVFRERMAQKTWAEFTQASIRAAMNVARGDVLPLNPNEPTRQHMWLVSNIFVTKAVDSIGAYSHVGGDAAAHVSHAKDAEGVRLLNRLDVDGANVLGHTVVDWQGDRWICQSVLPGIFSRREPEAEEAAEPKDDEKKEDWVKVEGDKEEEAALNPLIIYGADSEQTTTLHWDEATHNVMKKIAAHQRLAPHTLKAGDKEYEFYASSEVKGLRGSDGRRYFLDLPVSAPSTLEWLENNYEGKLVGPGGEQVDAPVYPHRMTLLRPELIEIFWESELKLWARDITAKKQAEEAEKAKAESEKTEAKESEETLEEDKKDEGKKEIDPETIATLKDFELRFNPDAFVDSPSEDGQTFGPAKYTDESDLSIKSVRDASKFLRDMIVPAIVVDVLTGSASGIMDGASLTRVMHARGINMRYLGIFAAAIDNFTKKPEGESKEAQGLLGALRSVVIQEMVFRGAKHVLRDLVRGLLPEQVPNAVSHFLNCLIGTDYNASPKAVYEELEVGPSAEPAYVSLTPESLREQIASEVETRFRWKLDEADFAVRKPQLLRELASRFAFQIVQRDYAFDSSAEAAAVVNGDADKAASKKKKGKTAGSTKRTTTFEPADILTLLPVVMSTAPSVAVAEEIFDAGRATINRGDIDMGLEFMLEGVQLYESIHSVIHPEVAAVYHQYASTLHQLARIKIQQIAAAENADPEQPLGLDISTALKLQRHAVLIAERTLGVYHHDTLAYYFQLAMLENLEGNSQAALRYFRHILMLWNVIYGDDHPEINTLLSNAGIVLQSLNQHQLSIQLLQQAAERNAAQFGEKHVQYGNALHQLTQAHFLGGDFQKALESSEGAFAIFKDVYGEEHAQTKEVAKNVELLKAVIDNVERQKQEQELLRQQQVNRLQAAQRGVPPPTAGARKGRVLPTGTTLTAEQAAQLAASVRAAAAKQAEERRESGEVAAEGEGGIKIGERGHMDVDELVKYIQGAVPSSKPARGSKNTLRGKRRTGAKR